MKHRWNTDFSKPVRAGIFVASPAINGESSVRSDIIGNVDGICRPDGAENYFGFASTNMPRLTALGISIRVFRVVRGQNGTAKYANHANKTSLGNGFWRDAENGNRDGRALQQRPSGRGERRFHSLILLTHVELFSIDFSMHPNMTFVSSAYFRSELQNAREDALKDAEAFDGIIHVVEKLGQFLVGEIKNLGQYQNAIEKVAEESPLAAEVPDQFRNVHSPFNLLYSIVRDARNDAMHIGASARHLPKHTIELALILEDALRTYEMSHNVSDYMVRNPICAELWQPISFIRQQMLTNSFTYLPLKKEGKWFLVSDFEIAKFLQGQSRKECLATPLEKAKEIELLPVELCSGKKPISEVLPDFGRTPILIGKNSDEGLEGILTAFDLL